jgi:arginyl-tRNA synthetase
MNMMDMFKSAIIKILKEKSGLERIELETPPNQEMGDYGFPCFALAKELKKNPNEIAQELCRKIPLNNIIKKVKVVGPYLNFFINKETLAKEVLLDVIKRKERYGSCVIKKSVLVEHTSINPNASPHVGRARNALIGDAIARLFRFNGCKVDVRYFVNDVGKQIAILVLGAKGKKEIEFNDLLKIYIQINKEIEKNPKIEKEVFQLLNKLENNDKIVKERFKQIVDVCINGQTKIFSELSIKYDHFDYESNYLWKKQTRDVLKKLERTKKLFTDEEGRLVLNQEEFDLAMKNKVLVLTRADKTSLYPLRDLAYTIDKLHRCSENIIVLGEDQKLYFEQIKAALSLLGYNPPKVVHYSFVLLKEGKMSTRKGNLVLLEDFMRQSRQKAKAEILKRNKKIAKKELEELSRIIGYGALKYSILKVSPEKNVTFDWQSALSFEGESAPYIQYAHARICSILRKHNKNVNQGINFSLLREGKETRLIKQIVDFPAIVQESLTCLKPHVIANYLYELAKVFNEFYHSCPILREKEELKNARLLLVSCVRQVLENGLNLLGIEAPDHM